MGVDHLGCNLAGEAVANSIDPKLQEWITARTRFRLSHAHVQMARELGLNPAKLGKIANHKQEPWKAPLPEYIEHLYSKRFGRALPEVVMSIEQRAQLIQQKKAARREARSDRRKDERTGKAVDAGSGEVVEYFRGDLQMATLSLTDDQIVELVYQLPPSRKRKVMSLLKSGWSDWLKESAIRGEDRMRRVASDRGKDWDKLSEEQRERFVDDLLHEE